MGGAGAEEGDVGEGGEAELISKLEFLLGVAFVVMVAGELDGG